VGTDNSCSKATRAVRERGGLAGDVFVPGGQHLLGGVPSQPWVFDAERYAHPVTVEPFEISKAPVTNAE
jgi:iron(II)-dependent oxidoreductase